MVILYIYIHNTTPAPRYKTSGENHQNPQIQDTQVEPPFAGSMLAFSVMRYGRFQVL